MTAKTWLGFAIGLDVILRAGGRDRTPGRAMCATCGHQRDLCYRRGDGTFTCVQCLHLDIAEHMTSHPDQPPVPALPYEAIRIGMAPIPDLYLDILR